MKHESVLTESEKLEIVRPYFGVDLELVALTAAAKIEQAILTKQAEKAQPVAEIRMTQYLPRSPVASVDSLIPIEQFNALPNGTKLYLGPPTHSALLDAASWQSILEAVMREMPRRGREDGNAPGHAHFIPGIWDKDNGELAGKECAWCKTWNMARAAIEAYKK